MRGFILLAFFSFFVTSCVRTGDPVEQGRAAFSHMQAAVTSATEDFDRSVVLVEVHESSDGAYDFSMEGMMRRRNRGQEYMFSGMVVSEEGHVLVGRHLEADSIARITVWHLAEELPARIIEAAPGVGATILAVDGLEEASVCDLSRIGDLEPGSWAVALTPTDEDRDFLPGLELGFCSGIVPGEFNRYIVQGANFMPGAVVANLDGEIVGLAMNSNILLAITDVADRYTDLIARATGSEPGEDNKAWIGLSHMAINPDYARKHDLPRGGIWITQVNEGSPAEEAGLRAGDLVVAVNGKDVRFSGGRAELAFTRALRVEKDKPFALEVLRDGERLSIEGTFAGRPVPTTLLSKELGVKVRNIDGALRDHRNLFTDEGVYIEEILQGSAAAVGSQSAQLGVNDVITTIDGTPTPDMEAFSAALENLRRENRTIVLVGYLRGRMNGYSALNLSLGEQ